MIIQLNTDNNLVIHEEYGHAIKELLAGELSHYSENISRLEVHLSDENGDKSSPDDKRCLLEARLDHRQPIAVSAKGNTYDQSIKTAAIKLKNSLETRIGKLKSH